jgi:hypothetical protein
MRAIMKFFIVAAMGAALVGMAQAQTAGTAQEQSACRPDVRKLCGHIGRSESDKYRDCLQTHFSELSPKCQSVLMNHSN